VRAALVLIAIAACDPVWSAHVRLRDPANHPIDGATVAVACREASPFAPAGASARTDEYGSASAGNMGAEFPVGCDIYVAKPGYRTHRIRYRDLCPAGSSDCERAFDFDLVLEPE
jgi:hypothetical protein